MMILAANVWHFWIGVLLAIPGLAMVIGTVALYTTRVVRPKYPRS